MKKAIRNTKLQKSKPHTVDALINRAKRGKVDTTDDDDELYYPNKKSNFDKNDNGYDDDDNVMINGNKKYILYY